MRLDTIGHLQLSNSHGCAMTIWMPTVADASPASDGSGTAGSAALLGCDGVAFMVLLSGSGVISVCLAAPNLPREKLTCPESAWERNLSQIGYGGFHS